MPNVHPVISSFPLAFLLLAAALEILQIFSTKNLRTSISLVLTAAAASLIATFLTGYQAISLAGELPKEIEAIAGAHHTMGRLSLIFGITTLMFCWVSQKAKYNRKVFTSLYYLSLIVAVTCCVVSSSRGGALVFDYGVGVTKPSSQVPTGTQPPPTL